MTHNKRAMDNLIEVFRDQVEDGLWDARLMGRDDATLRRSEDFRIFLVRETEANRAVIVVRDLLKGSEKQIVWAESIRKKFASQYAKTHASGVALATGIETEARIWIDARNKLDVLADKFQKQADKCTDAKSANEIKAEFVERFRESHPEAVSASGAIKDKSWIKNAGRMSAFADKIQQRAVACKTAADAFNAEIARRGGGLIAIDATIIELRNSVNAADKKLRAS